MHSVLVLALGAVAAAQQVYISAHGPSLRPYCTTTTPQCTAHPTGYASASKKAIHTPSYRFSKFSYTQTETVRTATAVKWTAHGKYAAPYKSLSHLHGKVSTTSWGNWNPNDTAIATDTANPFGQAAFTGLWEYFPLPHFTTGIYSTTVSPTPVPTSELVLPPPLYFGPQDCYSFPKEFMLGVAGSASQQEGALAMEGRGPAVVDLASLQGAPNYVAEEGYYLYKQDITRLAAIGVKYYSFSISWARIMPFAFPDTPVNSQAIKHYDDLINFILSKGMVPVVTLLHFDPPAALLGKDILGQATKRNYYFLENFGFDLPVFQEAYLNYGKIIMTHFADRVPIWITFNEPQIGVVSGPAIYNLIKSHARLVHFYRDTLNGTGKIGLKSALTPGVPLDPRNASHILAVQHWNDYIIGPFFDPLILGKDYPEVFKLAIQDYVPLNKTDLEYMKGTLDFFGQDAYVEFAISPIGSESEYKACLADNSTSNLHYPRCVVNTVITHNGWYMGTPAASIIGNTVVNTATYFRTTLNYLWNTYKIPIVLTEFGYTDLPVTGETIDDIRYDIRRTEFLLSHLTELLKAVWEDGVHVMGAFVWSWVDDWEFGTYTSRLGMQLNNATTQERTYKRSFFDLVDFVESRRQT